MKQLALILALAACSHSDKKPTTPSTDGGEGQTFAFKIGALDAVALKDGGMNMPNDGKMLALGQDPKAVADVLAKAGAPTDHFEFSIQPLLVKDGDKTLLFDTGLGVGKGHLQESLAKAGVKADAVTDIFISHSHFDHVGGLVDDKGALAFPNATVHMSKPEWAELQANEKEKAIATAIAPKVVGFEPGAQLLPEVASVDTRGHTQGHESYLITSNGASLFYTGDTVHNSVISVQRPSWKIMFDEDQDQGAKVRAALLAKLNADKTRVYVVHFPFPGVGHIGGSGDALVWNPE